MLFRRRNREPRQGRPPLLTWRSETRFDIGSLRFELLLHDVFSEKTSEDKIIILKERVTLTRMLDLIGRESPRRAFEFGIFQGGSTLMWTVALGLDRMAAVDVGESVPELNSIIRQHGLQDRIQLFYGCSQADRTRVAKIMDHVFGGCNVDLVIDDASHLYEETKASFETAFPFLRPGGLYVIEDWGWAHWPGHINPGFEGPALSNLILELVLATASSPDIIAEVLVWPSVLIVRKAQAAPVGAPILVDDLYTLRGRSLTKI